MAACTRNFTQCVYTKTIFLKVWPFRIYPPPSEFTRHLQNLPTTFRIYPTPSEFTHHLQNLPNTFIIFPTPSEISQHLHNLPTIFRIHPPPSEQICFEAVGPFWTFSPKSQDQKNNVSFATMICLEEHYEKIERP